LERDWERLVTFFAFPAEHWRHLRTSNVVESPFAAVRLRTSAVFEPLALVAVTELASAPRWPARLGTCREPL